MVYPPKHVLLILYDMNFEHISCGAQIDLNLQSTDISWKMKKT